MPSPTRWRSDGGADILVNNAGFMFEQSLDEMTEADWDRMMIVNMRAPVFLAKALLPQMRHHPIYIIASPNRHMRPSVAILRDWLLAESRNDRAD